MKEKIKTVEDYFKEKIVTGDFEIIEKEKYTFNVRVDGKYDFIIWVANRTENRKIEVGSYMIIELTQKEREKLHSVLSEEIRQYEKDVLREDKLAEFKRLQKELGLE